MIKALVYFLLWGKTYNAILREKSPATTAAKLMKMNITAFVTKITDNEKSNM